VTTSGLPTQQAAATAVDGPAGPASAWAGFEAAAREAGLSSAQTANLLRYRDLLLDWNARFNLTAVTAPEGIERRLLHDALRMLPAIDEAVADSGEAAPRLVDIGSGGGVPALPIAICRPTLSVTMVEATGKKVRFLSEAIAELGLRNAAAIHARAEDIARELDHRAAYEVATARAVSSLPALIELAMPLLRPRGVALFPKGVDLADELRAGERAAREVGAEIASADELPGGETRLVVVRKRRPTPERYPRRAGIPAREPLGVATGHIGVSPGRTPR
jgi:16S rRNA (guanine527-N7)-methyltransferase